MTRLYPSNEPARQPDYKRAYAKMHDRVANLEGCNNWLLDELRALQKRVDKLEQHNAHIAANMVRAASERAEEIWDDIKQRDKSSTPP